jgi:GT2 family glycosyltransferase
MHPESQQMSEGAIIIVSYNCREALRDCLHSLPAGRVVVVDNASADNSADLLRTEFPSVTLIANETNRGFAAACNQGIAATTEPFVLLLNPDTTNPPLPHLVKFMHTHTDAGACGPRIQNPNGSLQVSCRRFPTWWRMALAELGCRWFYYVPWPGVDVDQLMGSCLLLRRTALEQAGVLDERFFVYFEEVDLCLRLKQAGWRVCYVDDAIITHIGGQSSQTDRAVSLRYRYESLFAFYRKHYRAWQLFLLKWAVQIGAAFRRGLYSAIAREVWRM